MKSLRDNEGNVVNLAEFEDINFVSSVGGKFPISTDALNINSDYSWNGRVEMLASSVDGTKNLPAGVTHALKFQLQYNSQNVVVLLLELYPTLGRIWINKYTTTSSWGGWKAIVPGS